MIDYKRAPRAFSLWLHCGYVTSLLPTEIQEITSVSEVLGRSPLLQGTAGSMKRERNYFEAFSQMADPTGRYTLKYDDNK